MKNPAILAEFAAWSGRLVTVVSFDAFAAFIAHTFTAPPALAHTGLAAESWKSGDQPAPALSRERLKPASLSHHCFMDPNQTLA